MAGPALQLLRALRSLRPLPPTAASAWISSPAASTAPPTSCALQPAWRTCHVRPLQLCSALSAGHNKWSKVKHIKGPKDEARGKVFSKLGMLIKIAVKEGGPNPELNTNLAQILEQCRSKNMPKASIEAAIKIGEKAKPASLHMFEARGPGGFQLLIEVLTDNTSLTRQDIRRLLNKNGGMLSDGARHNFNKRGVVLVASRDVTTEKALELAIEAGAEDIQETEDEEETPHLRFICDTDDLQKVRSSLVELGMQVTSAEVEFVPRTLLSLPQDQLDTASTLINALTDNPDVVRVWDNIQPDS